MDNNTTIQRQQEASRDSAINQGLRKHMLGVYNYMCSAILLTAVTSMLVSKSPSLMALIFNTPLKWVVFLAPLGLVFYLSARLMKLKLSTARTLFFVYAASVGLMISSIFIVYSGISIAKTFFITAAAFAGLSLYGYTTKRSLSAMGSFMVMGLIGLIIAMVVNIFLQSAMMDFIISCVGVLIFAGLTAWDTQKIKEMYLHNNYQGTVAAKISIYGALALYLDFLNMFLFLLRFFGSRE